MRRSAATILVRAAAAGVSSNVTAAQRPTRKRFRLPPRLRRAPQRASKAAPVVDAEMLTRRGLDAHRRGDVDAAVRDYRAALALDPGANTATHYLGVAHYQRGNSRRCPSAGRALARDRHPTRRSFTTTPVCCMRRSIGSTTPLPRIAARSRARADHVAAWNNLGLALAQRNDLDEAVDAYRKRTCARPRLRRGALESRAGAAGAR